MAFNLNLGTLSVGVKADTSDLSRAKREVARSSKGMGKSLDGVSNKANRVGTSFSGLGSVLAGVFTVELARRTLMIADNMTLLDSKIRAVSRSSEEFAKVKQNIRDVAMETGSSIENIASMTQRMLIAGETLGATTEQINTISGSFAKLGVIGGSTFDQMKFAQLQFGQAMSGNVVRAEEFNSLIENTPLVAKAIADGMGKTTGQLQRMVKEGKALTKDVFAALLSQTQKIDDTFADIPMTLTRATGQIEVAITEIIQALDDETGITSSLAEAMSNLAEQLREVAKDSGKVKEVIDTATLAFEALAVVLLTRVGMSVGVYANKAAVAVASTLALSAASKTTASNVGAMGFAYGSATKKITLASRAMTTMAVAGRGLLALLGGIPAVIFTVVTSLALFIDWETKAEKQARKVEDAVRKQKAAMDDLTTSDIKKEMESLGDEAVNLSFSINDATEKVKKLKEKTKGQVGPRRFLTEKAKKDLEELSKASDNLLVMQNRLEIVSARFKTLESSLKVTGEKGGKGEVVPITPTGGNKKSETDKILEGIDAEILKLQDLHDSYGILGVALEEFHLNKRILTEQTALINANASDKEIELLEKKHKKLLESFNKYAKKKAADEKKAADAKKKSEKDRADRELEAERRKHESNVDLTIASIGKIFGIEKEAAVVMAGLDLQRAIAKTMGDNGAAGFAAIAPIAAAFANVISTVRSLKAPSGGRAFGGTVSAMSPTPINERGNPEMFVNNSGRQFLLPDQSGKVVPLESGGAMGGSPNITIINNSDAVVREPVVTQGQLMIEIDSAVERAVTQVNTSLASQRGETFESARQGLAVSRNI